MLQSNNFVVTEAGLIYPRAYMAKNDLELILLPLLLTDSDHQQLHSFIPLVYQNNKQVNSKPPL